MTAEVEILKFLREHELPAGELVYREEDCAYITIKAIEQLQQELENQTSDYEDTVTDLEEEIKTFKKQLADKYNEGYSDACKETISQVEALNQF